ncbi:MAG: methyltransferase domain-containing protein [Acidobacteria bacterium]|nr:methyltransferase domain-containing protein [Acidobacteriota bacterium]MCB9396660.1 methyltransferase domain-containing protein [Acidobacteriota bacterium]
MRLLAICKHGEFSVTELVQIIGQSQPRVSRHLKLLCEAGLLERFREQNFVFYRLAAEGFGATLGHFLLKNLNLDAETLRLDGQRAEQVLESRQKEAEEILAKLSDQMRCLATLLPRESKINQAIQACLKEVPIGDLLDIGTGTGRMLKLLAKKAASAVGVDISPEMLRVARSQLHQAGLSHITVRQGDMYHLAYPNESFDTITIDHVLSLAENPAAVLSEVARLLKPGGHLFLLDFETTHWVDQELASPLEMGIQRQEVIDWCAECGLDFCKQNNLPGNSLEVLLFLFQKNAGGQ